MSRHVSITHRRSRRASARVSLVAIGSLLLAALSVLTPAQAAVPANDTYQAATRITSTPFTHTVDTTEATADVGMGNYRFHGVWYRVKMQRDGRLFMSLQGSDFSPKMLRMYRVDNTGAPGDVVKSGTTWGSNYPRFIAPVEGGEAYYLLIGTDSDGPGGLAKLTVRRPARLSYSLAPDGRVDRVDGSAVLFGTFQASRPVKVFLELRLRQAVGDRIVSGYVHRDFDVSTTKLAWRLHVSASRSFRVGKARIAWDSLRIWDDGVYVATKHFVRRTVTLR